MSTDPVSGRQEPDASDVSRRSFQVHAGRVFDVIGPFLGLLFVVGLFSIKPDVRHVFLTGGNFKIILTQTVIVAIAAIGMTLIIVSGGIDLSVGSVVALCSVAAARLLSLDHPWSPIAVACATVLIGGGVGFLTGSLVAGFRLLPFIVTLGMMGIARGGAKWLANNQAVDYDTNSPVNKLMELNVPFSFFPLPTGVWITAGLAVIMTVVLAKTVFGRHIFALGSSEPTARLCGIRVNRQKIVIYTLAGFFFGMSGLLQLSRLTVGDPTVATGLELDVIAAVVIGGASLSGGTGSILGSMIGAVIMAVLRNGSQQMEWPTYVQEVIIGIVIVLAVGVDRLRQRNPGA